MPKKKPKRSSVMQLLDLAFVRCRGATTASKYRLDQTMQDAVVLAINAGFRFDPHDWQRIVTDYPNRGYRLEPCYALAIQTCNLSAAIAIEDYRQRPPFILDDVNCDQISGYLFRRPYVRSNTFHRNHSRAGVGHRFTWRGYTMTVTSFLGVNEDARLIACAYAPPAWPGGQGNITKRIRISVADIHADRADRKTWEPVHA